MKKPPSSNPHSGQSSLERGPGENLFFRKGFPQRGSGQRPESCLSFKFPQSQGVGDDGDGGEGHGGAGEHGGEGRAAEEQEQSCGHGHEEHVIGEGPEQAEAYVRQRGSPKAKGRLHTGQAAQKHHVTSFCAPPTV